MSGAPVFDIGTLPRFLQKLCDSLVYGIQWRDERELPVGAHVLASILGAATLPVALVLGYFTPGNLTLLAVDAVVALLLSLLFSVFYAFGAKMRVSRHGEPLGSFMNFAGAALYPNPRKAGLFFLNQVCAVVLAVSFFAMVYYGFIPFWTGVFVAMLWSPALRGLDHGLSAFAPGQSWECSLTHAMYLAVLLATGLVRLRVQVGSVAIPGPQSTVDEIMAFSLTLAQVSAYATPLVCVLPFCLFLGVFPQVLPFFAWVFDFFCRGTGLSATTPWSFGYGSSVILLTFLGKGLGFAPPLLHALSLVSPRCFQRTPVAQVVYKILCILAAAGVAVAGYFVCGAFGGVLSHFGGDPAIQGRLAWQAIPYPIYLVPVVGVVLVALFHLLTAFLFAKRGIGKKKGAVYAKVCVVLQYICSVGVCGLAVYEHLLSGGLLTKGKVHLGQAAFLNVQIATAVHLALTDPASLFSALTLGGLVTTLTFYLTPIGKDDLADAVAGRFFAVNPFYICGAPIAASAFLGHLLDNFLHRLAVAARFYVSIFISSRQKEVPRWSDIMLYCCVLLVPWNIAVILVCSFFNLPIYPVGGTPAFLPSFPRFSRFLWSSAPRSLAGTFSRDEGVSSRALDKADDLLIYESFVQSLTGISGSAPPKSELYYQLLRGCYGSAGILLPGAASLGFGSPRRGDVLLLMSGKRMLMLRVQGLGAFGTSFTMDVTALETKETSCHTLERTCLENMAEAARKGDLLKAGKAGKAGKAAGGSKKAVPAAGRAPALPETPKRLAGGAHGDSKGWGSSDDPESSDGRGSPGLAVASAAGRAGDSSPATFAHQGGLATLGTSPASPVLGSGPVDLAPSRANHLPRVLPSYKAYWLPRFREKISTESFECCDYALSGMFTDKSMIEQMLLLFCKALYLGLQKLRGRDAFLDKLASLSRYRLSEEVEAAVGELRQSLGTDLQSKEASRLSVATASLFHLLRTDGWAGLQEGDIAPLFTGESLGEFCVFRKPGAASSGVGGDAEESEEEVIYDYLLGPPQPSAPKAEPPKSAPNPLTVLGGPALRETLEQVYAGAFTEQEKREASSLAREAMGKAVECFVQCVSMGDEVPQSLEEAHEYFDGQAREVYIGASRSSPDWQRALQGGEYDRLFTLEGDGSTPRVFEYRRGSVEWSVFHYPCYAYESIWATVQADLVFFGSSDEERFSVQSLPSVLRNLFSEASTAPYGYPLREFGAGEV